jgi:hypothetical protein
MSDTLICWMCRKPIHRLAKRIQLERGWGQVIGLLLALTWALVGCNQAAVAAEPARHRMTPSS